MLLTMQLSLTLRIVIILLPEGKFSDSMIKCNEGKMVLCSKASG